jgi:hypothetical protein
MKTRLIILVMLIVCFSCGTNNKPLSDAQKEKIKTEVKVVADAMFKGCEEANFEMATESFLDSPDFVYIFNGVSMNYQGVVNAVKPLFNALINQKVTISNEKYNFLNNSTVIYTTNSKFLENYKDGHAVLSDPMVIQVTLRNINGTWKTINGVESSVRQNAKNTETSKELNQLELMKQWIGTWKCDISKDTTFLYDVKSYGTGYDNYSKVVVKGKMVKEGKLFIGYDQEVDKFIISAMEKGGDIGIYVTWWLSKTKWEEIPYNNISNPENASWKEEGEFKSPDMMIETTLVNNKPVKSKTWIRVK